MKETQSVFRSGIMKRELGVSPMFGVQSSTSSSESETQVVSSEIGSWGTLGSRATISGQDGPGYSWDTLSAIAQDLVNMRDGAPKGEDWLAVLAELQRDHDT